RMVPRRRILVEMATSPEGSMKAAPGTAYWARQKRSTVTPRAIAAKLHQKVGAAVHQLLRFLFLSRLEAIDMKLTYLFDESNSSTLALAQKVDDALWSRSSKLDSYFADLQAREDQRENALAAVLEKSEALQVRVQRMQDEMESVRQKVDLEQA